MLDSAIEMNTLKTLLYMGVMHGFFTFYLPYQLASRDMQLIDTGVLRSIALPFWAIGALIIIQSSADLIRRGQGTPAHLDPPRELVINGWYRYVRNPIYLAALLIQLGFTLWFGSGIVIVYCLLFAIAYNILIYFIEEPMLRNTFGADYEAYCRAVPRWIPRMSRSKD